VSWVSFCCRRAAQLSLGSALYGSRESGSRHYSPGAMSVSVVKEALWTRMSELGGEVKTSPRLVL